MTSQGAGPPADRPATGHHAERRVRAVVQLPYLEPHDVHATLRFHGLHAVAGVETWDGTTFRRTLRLPGGPGRLALRPVADRAPGGATAAEAAVAEAAAAAGAAKSAAAPVVVGEFELTDPADLPAAVAVARRLLDLDAEPGTIDAALRAEPALTDLVDARPGMRSPGAADGPELAVRTVVGQQVSLAGARTVLGRIVTALGERAFADQPGLLFPTAQALATADPALLPMPRARRETVARVSAAVSSGQLVLEPGADPAMTRQTLLALRGIGPWTADYLLMRVLGEPDVLLDTDLAVRRVAATRGLDLRATSRFSPWRSYLTHHLWAIALAELP